MSEAQVSANETDQFWKDHVLTAQQFMGTDQEYCRRNELNAGTFSAYKVKLGFTKPRKVRGKAFVKVEPKRDEAPRPPKVPAPRSPALPDPRWTAELIRALINPS